MLYGGCAHNPPLLAGATTRDDGALVVAGEDPLVKVACSRGKEGEAQPSHFMVNVWHLGGGNIKIMHIKKQHKTMH